MRAWVTVFLFLFVLGGVSASGVNVIGPNWQAYKLGANFTFAVQAYDATDTPVTDPLLNCTVLFYNSSGKELLSQGLAQTGYSYAASVDSAYFAEQGEYRYSAWCSGLAGSGHSENAIFITPTGRGVNVQQDYTPLAVIVALPALLAIILIIGAATLSPEEHGAMKIFLFLASSIPFFVSIWWGLEVIARYYDAPELVDALGSGIFIFGIMFSVLILYVILYFIYKAVRTAAQEKDERLSY